MHCKFLVFLLIVFFFFLFFSSSCEFQFIERIGTHGKQNPDFIILLLYYYKLRPAYQASVSRSREMAQHSSVQLTSRFDVERSVLPAWYRRRQDSLGFGQSASRLQQAMTEGLLL